MVVIVAVLFAVLAALFFSLQGVASRKAVIGKEVIPGAFLSMTLGVPLLLPIIFWTGDVYTIFQTSPKSLLLLAAMGLLQYVAGIGLYIKAVKMIGNTRSTPIRETSLIHSVLFGVILLNETISLLSTLAIVLIIFGVLMSSISGEAVSQGQKRNFLRSNLFKGIMIGLVSASFWGFAPILIKSALPGVSSPLMATWFSFVFGAIGWILILVGTRKVSGIRRLGKSSITLFLVAGVMTAVAQLFRFSALGLGAVVLVVPVILGVNPIFSLILSAILIRDIEGINKFVIIGIIVSAIGAVLVARGI